MENLSSVQNLCLQLISSAFQRCRLSEDLCRLSVVLCSSGDFDSPLTRISISDTGVRSCLEEFQDLRYAREADGAEKWDGMLSLMTTSFSDDEIYNYQINLKMKTSASRLTRLPSKPKNGVKFSGTRVCLTVSEDADILMPDINHFFQKALILKIPNVTMDVVVEKEAFPSSRDENVFLADDYNVSCCSGSNVERLKSGLEDYVLKHGNALDKKCDSCFSTREHLKVGSGKACQGGGHKSSGLMMEAVIIISELLESTSLCCRSRDGKSEVLYFKDFSPSPIPQSAVNALANIDWKNYGLILETAKDQDGHALLEWGNFPPYAQIDIVLHWHDTQMPSVSHKTQPSPNITKKAVKLALDDLKQKHEGFLLSSHALKICSYVPDLARTIAGLIFSSNDSDFKGECFSLLGLQCPEVGPQDVEDCVKNKIISIVGLNDRKPQKTQDAAPFLFLDDEAEKLYFQDEEYEGECCLSLD